jgi:WD40 repeat protein
VLMKRHRITASVVAFWPDLTTFAAADDLPNGDGEVVMWDMATGDRCWSVTFNQHDTHLQTLSFMANGRVLAADGGGGTQLDWRWRTTLWDVTSAPTEIGSFAETPAVSPDGDLLAIPLDAGAKLLKVSAQERGTDLVVNGDGGASAFVSYNNMKFYPTPSFSPDSKMMVIKGLYRFSQEPLLARWLPRTLNPFRADPGGSVVHLWDTGSRRKVFTFRRCSDIWFSPDGQVLATLRDEAVDLWRVQRFGSLWHTLCRAGLVCLMVLPIGWLTWKALISRCFVAQGDKPGRSPIR